MCAETLPPSSHAQLGQVIRYHSDRFVVKIGALEYQCLQKGLLKKEGQEVYTGDRVWVDAIDTANQHGRIIAVDHRQNVLQRPKVANIDQVIILQPLTEPTFDFEQLDRFLAQVALAQLPVVIGVSKSDLSDNSTLRATIQQIYADGLGYPLLFTSIHTPTSLQQLETLATGKTSVLAGVSGAGKSSLINALNPALNLKVQAVSDKIQRGTHTTRHVSLLEVKPTLFICDSPGFSHLAFDTVLPVDLEAIYPDFEPYRGHCQFSNCLHTDEAGCAVMPAVADNRIAQQRYDHYLLMLAEAKTYAEAQKASSQKPAKGYKTLDRKGKQVKILRLDGKQRDAGRNTQKQQLDQHWALEADTSDELS